MKIDIERRITISDLELRADGEVKKIVGHAAVFNQLSDDLGGFREQIKPGAFKRSLKDGDIRALVNHETRLILGRTTAKTLALEEDDRGLLSEIAPPDTTYAHDLIESLKRGDITQMSFAFRVRAGGQEWDEDDEGNVVRTLTDLELFEVSPVTFPAYPQTDVAARSLDHWRKARGNNTARRLRMDLRMRQIAR